MAKRFRQFSVLFAMVFAFSFAAPAQDAADPGSVKVPWEEFKKLLDLARPGDPAGGRRHLDLPLREKAPQEPSSP